MKKAIKVLTLVGGSGGHVTPAVAVLRELKQRFPDGEFRVWCDPVYIPEARRLVHTLDATIPVQKVLSGKLRRYHHLTWWQHFTIPSVVFLNIRDVFFVIAGFFQSMAMLLIWRPDVVFAKGGYVSVPAGLSAKLLHIPLVIHDSDSHPGFANRILARFATLIATGAPLNNYPYDKKRAQYTGIPVNQDFHPYTDEERKTMKAALGFEPERPLVVITGGGLGAGYLNEAVAKQLNSLLKFTSVLLLSGTAHYDAARALTPENNTHFQLLPFITSEEMARSLGAADIVVSRAGATTILELSALAKPTILIPGARFTGGHQLKNAAEYSKNGAALVLGDEDVIAKPELLATVISSLLEDPAKRARMAKAFHALFKPHAAEAVADLVEMAAKEKSTSAR